MLFIITLIMIPIYVLKSILKRDKTALKKSGLSAIARIVFFILAGITAPETVETEESLTEKTNAEFK